ncbi:kinase-like domain-containing protein [Lasiosphaeria hispida]|uniref:non-specific serine/threonine protein kinase n=1 Tax=Lasiosphaeria hispida TaxID=260671 RepID=A0AAJ0HXP8_9PEZI|nr:kinase-like domain-containing protein [Lasiosphaeria hispida]
MGIRTYWCPGTVDPKGYHAGLEAGHGLSGQSTGTPSVVVAMGVSNFRKYACKQVSAASVNEMTIHSHLQHANIVSYVDHSPSDRLLITELCSGHLRPSHLRRAPDGLREDLCRLAEQLLKAVSYLHNDAGTVHLDIHPENILLTGSSHTLTFKLANFSHATKAFNWQFRGFRARVDDRYLAPEWRADRGAGLAGGSSSYADRCDVYALGATLLDMVLPGSQWHAVGEDAVKTALLTAFGLPVDPQAFAADPLCQLLSRMVWADPAGRPSAAECLAWLYGHFGGEAAFARPRQAGGGDDMDLDMGGVDEMDFTGFLAAGRLPTNAALFPPVNPPLCQTRDCPNSYRNRQSNDSGKNGNNNGRLNNNGDDKRDNGSNGGGGNRSPNGGRRRNGNNGNNGSTNGGGGGGGSDRPPRRRSNRNRGNNN